MFRVCRKSRVWIGLNAWSEMTWKCPHLLPQTNPQDQCKLTCQDLAILSCSPPLLATIKDVQGKVSNTRRGKELQWAHVTRKTVLANISNKPAKIQALCLAPRNKKNLKPQKHPETLPPRVPVLQCSYAHKCSNKITGQEMNEGNIVIQWSKNISEEAQVKQKFFFFFWRS